MIRAIKKMFGGSRGKPEILVIGDSHAGIFEEPEMKAMFPDHVLNVVLVGGATASGLSNPNSKTQAYPVFREVLDTAKAGVVVVQLGEVDTGFIIWYRSRKYRIPVKDMLRKTVETYAAFLSEIAENFLVVCLSAPLPTISDENNWGDVANARREVTVPQKDRTELTLAFNREMEACCLARGIRYVNMDHASLGEDGLVKKSLMNSDDLNHHYDKTAYMALLRECAVGAVLEESRGNVARGVK